MYDQFSCDAFNETTALFFADLPQTWNGNDCAPACSTLNGNYGPFHFWDDQFSSLYAWRSIGNSAYHSMQLTLRKAMSHGFQFDFNYTVSKSIDVGSNAERISLFEGFGFASQVINSWAAGQLRAPSDFDMRHQINANWVYELPFGRGHQFGSNANKFVDAVFGGWSLSGIFHWTSGLPFTMASGEGWSTNWELEGAAVQLRKTPKIGVFRDSAGNPNMFQDPGNVTLAQASSADACPTGGCYFRFPYPGESGQRNNLRGPGYLELDGGLYKSWRVTERQTLKFAWEVFNVTNTPRFDAGQSSYNFGLTFGNFGAYTNTLSIPRVMQFGVRYDF